MRCDSPHRWLTAKIEHRLASKPTQPGPRNSAIQLGPHNLRGGRRAEARPYKSWIGVEAVGVDALTYSAGRAADSARRIDAGANTGRPACDRSPCRAWRSARASASSRPRSRFCRSCSSLRAPMTTLATVGRCSSQFSATCGTGLADLFGGLFSAHRRPCTSIRPRPAGRNPPSCGGGSLSGSGLPRRILPVSRPQPSGLQTIVPTL